MCISIGSFLSLFYRRHERSQWRLKYCTAFSCSFAAAFVLKVPRFLRLPVFGFFLREYSRYSPDFSLRITSNGCVSPSLRLAAITPRNILLRRDEAARTACSGLRDLGRQDSRSCSASRDISDG